MKGLFILLFFTISSLLFAGNEFNGKGAESNAFGNCTSTLINAFSIHNNQGAAAFLEQASFGLSYRSSFWPVNIPEVNFSAAAPVSVVILGGSVSYIGNNLFYEIKTSLACAVRIGEKIGLGIQLDYLHSKAQNHHGRHFATFEVGLLYQPINEVRIGVHLYNPIKYKTDDASNEILPIIMNIGIQYNPHESVTLLAEFEKDIYHPFNFKGGLGYKVMDDLTLRGGFTTQPLALSFGLGYRLKDPILLDVGSNYHFDLGFNTSVSFSFLLDRSDDQ